MIYEQDTYEGAKFMAQPRAARRETAGPAWDETHVLAVYEQIDAIDGSSNDLTGQVLAGFLGEVKRALANPGSRHATDVMRAIARYEAVRAATWVGVPAPDDLDSRHQDNPDA